MPLLTHSGFRRAVSTRTKILPMWFFLPGLQQTWSNTLHYQPGAGSLARENASQPVDVTLGPDLVLRKELNVPHAAAKKRDKVVDTAMRQTQPGAGDNLIWRHGISQRTENTLVLDIYVVKQALLDSILSEARDTNTQVRTIRAQGAPHIRPFLDRRARTDLSLRIWAGVCTVLFISTLFLLLWNGFQTNKNLDLAIEKLNAQKSQLMDQAVSLKKQSEQQDISRLQVHSDLDTFMSEYRRLPILLDLTAHLSDKTWVSEFAISGNGLRLSGFTQEEVPEVMKTISALEYVTDVQLEGQIATDRITQSKRFSIVASLTTPEATKE